VKKWYGRWLEDELQPDGSIIRIHRSEVLGDKSGFPTKRLAAINSPIYKAKPTANFEDFAEKNKVMIHHERSGCIFAGPVPSFCAKVFTSGRGTPSRSRCGHEAITSNFAPVARDITLPCELWLSNGFASYFVVGKTEWLMMKTNIWPCSPGVVLP
jgi:hypothetical protein